MEQDQEFLDFVVKAIVNNPDGVKTERTVDERGVLLTLDVTPSDMGYVIGRQGQTARAIRTLLKIVGAKNNARVNLKINEPEGGAPRPSSRPPFNPSARPSFGQSTSAPAQTAPVSQMHDDDIDTSAVDNLTI